ncbi:MAG: nitroreductase [Eggerthellaceae bacterium]|nr:nitroreductase [Eggerthellaceae bacterium]
MNVERALSTRYSARAYLPKPVEPQVIKAVLQAAERTPSWGNSQPWEVFVASGAALERIRNGFAENYESSVPPKPDVPRPPDWPEAARKNIKELSTSQREGEFSDAFKGFLGLNHRFFDAPMVAYLCLDKALSPWSLYDLGAYSESLILAATEHGLGTIPAINLVAFPDIIREELGIPENLDIAIGVAIGYPDVSNKINTYRSPRRPFDEAVRFFN